MLSNWKSYVRIYQGIDDDDDDDVDNDDDTLIMTMMMIRGYFSVFFSMFTSRNHYRYCLQLYVIDTSK